jgi:phosphatidylserine/phosphatidylglycerophosphate/cardiolipin synthase-like enzyme
VLLRRAEKRMDICVFAFTNDALRESLLYAHNKGVKIRIIGDDECAKFMGAEIFFLCLAGIEACIDDNWRAHMHNKYVLIDD